MGDPTFKQIPQGTTFQWQGDTWLKTGPHHAKRASDRQTRFVPSEDRVMLAETDANKQLAPPQNQGEDTPGSDENTTESEENAPQEDGPGE